MDHIWTKTHSKDDGDNSTKFFTGEDCDEFQRVRVASSLYDRIESMNETTSIDCCASQHCEDKAQR